MRRDQPRYGLANSTRAGGIEMRIAAKLHIRLGEQFQTKSLCQASITKRLPFNPGPIRQTKF